MSEVILDTRIKCSFLLSVEPQASRQGSGNPLYPPRGSCTPTAHAGQRQVTKREACGWGQRLGLPNGSRPVCVAVTADTSAEAACKAPAPHSTGEELKARPGPRDHPTVSSHLVTGSWLKQKLLYAKTAMFPERRGGRGGILHKYFKKQGRSSCRGSAVSKPDEQP